MTHKHTNQLINENSPYLLQHAHNPVNWYPWGEEAFEKARKEGKPLLVSIGYSTCHWCHVMERESFENETVATFMNKNFINIKVDREERPDIDSIYMEAVQMITGGHGGWPLNCFLLPDGRPFFGGTYFPPQNLQGRSSWMHVLRNISDAFMHRHQEVERQAEKLMSYLQRADVHFMTELDSLNPDEEHFTKDYLHEGMTALKEGFDSKAGGFGHAPKFPMIMALRSLLLQYHYEQDMEAMSHLQLSLDAMIYGGIYDQLRGGLARYAVDRIWLVPHFEKMLYDNALLIGLLADTYKLTHKELYRETIADTIGWLKAEMLSPEGGFYSALDADSEGVEGKFYVWSKTEVEEVLGEDAELFCAFYDITEEGNWEGHNIPRRLQSLSGFATDRGMDEQALAEKLAELRQQLLERRATRVRPGLDDKILLGWNAMLSTGLIKAFQATKEPEYLTLAKENIDFLLSKFKKSENSYYHTYKDGQAKYPAFLDDYALLIEALLQLYQTTFEESYLQEADRLAKLLMEEFLDPVDQLFYYTAAEQQDVIVRKKDFYDSAVPSGNSTMIHNLQQLGTLLDNNEYRQQAYQSLLTLKDSLLKYPQSFGRWLNAAYLQVHPSHEIAIVGENYLAKAQKLQQHFLPNTVFAAAERPNPVYPLLAGRQVEGDAQIFVCSNYACKMPVKTEEEALELL